MSLLVGIDIGGTFTDAIALEVESGRLIPTKVPSTPEDFAHGFFNAVDKVLKMAGASAADVVRLVHGTTVATNSIVQWNGAKIGILTTRGFRDLLFIGRIYRSDVYGVQYGPGSPTFLCERERIVEIRERMDAQGEVVTPLNEDDVIKAADYLVQKHRVGAIAICYLFSFEIRAILAASREW